jgi:hypothetical protein
MQRPAALYTVPNDNAKSRVVVACLMSYYPLRNATSRWLPSQYGFLFDCPQRQSQVSVTRLTVCD